MWDKKTGNKSGADSSASAASGGSFHMTPEEADAQLRAIAADKDPFAEFFEELTRSSVSAAANDTSAHAHPLEPHIYHPPLPADDVPQPALRAAPSVAPLQTAGTDKLIPNDDSASFGKPSAPDIEAEIAKIFEQFKQSEVSSVQADVAAALEQQPLENLSIETAPAKGPDAYATGMQKVSGHQAPKPAHALPIDFNIEKTPSSDLFKATDFNAPLVESARGGLESDYVADTKSRSGAFVAMAVIGLALVGGLGVMLYRGVSGKGSMPQIIKAEQGPNKIVPENPGGAEIPNQNKLIFERMAGSSSDNSQNERVVNTEEKPSEVIGNNGKPVRVVGPSAGNTPGAVEPKRVKTVVIRPDGTVVTDQSSAPGAPVVTAVPASPQSTVRSNVPVATPSQQNAALSETNPASSVSAATIRESANVDFNSDAFGAPPPAPRPRPSRSQETAKPAKPKAQSATLDGSAAAPVVNAPSSNATTPEAAGAPRSLLPQVTPGVPAGRDTLDTRSIPSVGSTASQPVAIAPSVASGRFTVQLSAQPSESEANNAFANARNKYRALEGLEPNIQRADIPNVGVRYRVRAGAFATLDEANTVCNRIKSQGGSCFATKR